MVGIGAILNKDNLEYYANFSQNYPFHSTHDMRIVNSKRKELTPIWKDEQVTAAELRNPR